MDMTQITAFVTAKGKPAVVSLSDDTHIFHFSDAGDFERSPILFVNRNGHHFRVIPTGTGEWLFAGTWNGIFETTDWQTKANLRRTDPVALINLCGIGPQGTRGKQFESLCLLPRDATTGRRKAAYRQNLVDVFFDRNTDTFQLMHPVTGERVTFSGKLWESEAAVAQAAAWFIDNKPKIAVMAKKGPLTTEQVATLEDNPLWGMF